MKFSIVIPTFNSREYVVECVRSALHQTYRNIEVVIDDNTSRDGTPELLKKEFGHDKRLVIFENKEDLNIPLGWNRGIRNSTGEFFLLLHSDNLLHPRYVETIAALQVEFRFDVAYSEAIYFEGETPPALFDESFSVPQLPVAFLSGGRRTVDYVFRFQRMIPTSCLAVRRSCLGSRSAFDPNFKWDPDIELMNYLASGFKVLHVEFPLAAIRTHEGQAAAWRDPSFSRQYRDLLRLTNRTAGSEPHHFLLHWAGSNQDICEKLSTVPGAPLKIYFKFLKSWIAAELLVVGHFARYFLRKARRFGHSLGVFFASRFSTQR